MEVNVVQRTTNPIAEGQVSNSNGNRTPRLGIPTLYLIAGRPEMVDILSGRKTLTEAGLRGLEQIDTRRVPDPRSARSGSSYRPSRY